MNLFLKKTLYFFAIPVIYIAILLTGYLINDPFRIIYSYKSYSHPNVVPNRDYITTEMFLKNYSTHHYNSFIFGSSRTLAFSPYSWKKYLGENDQPFMFDGSAESIYGIYKKMSFLDSMHVKIDNSLIILCRDVTFLRTTNNDQHLFIKHPAISRESRLVFHWTFFKAYLDPFFLVNYYTYKTFHKFRPMMEGYIEHRLVEYDTVTNKMTIIEDSALSPNAKKATVNSFFYTRTGETVDSMDRIGETQLFMLKEIKRILEKNETKYKLVISPLYEQRKFTNKDLGILKGLFGDKLYDFSGKNSFTDNTANYYETSHFRPFIGDSIMANIYRTGK